MTKDIRHGVDEALLKMVLSTSVADETKRAFETKIFDFKFSLIVLPVGKNLRRQIPLKPL